MSEESIYNKPIIQDIEHVSGDKFERVWTGIVDINGISLDMSTGTAKMVVRKSFRYDPIITIEDVDLDKSVAGKLSCDLAKFELDPAGRYEYQIQYTNADNENKTVVEGEFLILNDIAK